MANDYFQCVCRSRRLVRRSGALGWKRGSLFVNVYPRIAKHPILDHLVRNKKEIQNLIHTNNNIAQCFIFLYFGRLCNIMSVIFSFYYSVCVQYLTASSLPSPLNFMFYRNNMLLWLGFFTQHGPDGWAERPPV